MVDLRDNELEAMRILWESSDPLKPGDIQERFAWEIDNGTLRSTLKVLVDKGHIHRSKAGKAFFYRPLSTRERVLSGIVGRLSRIFTGGSPAELIAQLVKTEKLSPEEIEELRQIADESAPKKRRTRS